MTWVLRVASDRDRELLRRFKCDSGFECPVCRASGHTFHEAEVEAYLRYSALDEMQWRRPYTGHTLQLLIDAEGDLARAIAHERWEILADGMETPSRRLVVAPRFGTTCTAPRLAPGVCPLI